MKIRFDKDCINWDDSIEYNECFINVIVGYFKADNGLHCLNDIYDAIGLSKTIAGYSCIWNGPIEISYEKFDDHIDIEIKTMPSTVFCREKYLGVLQEENKSYQMLTKEAAERM